jgi:hypothetical protein
MRGTRSTTTATRKGRSAITDAKKHFEQAQRFLLTAERQFNLGEPIGPVVYLLRLVLDDLVRLNQERSQRGDGR